MHHVAYIQQRTHAMAGIEATSMQVCMFYVVRVILSKGQFMFDTLEQVAEIRNLNSSCSCTKTLSSR